ncbi:MAG: hypothetical protein N2235_05925 [Fischerella sp.]|nr:hypothetical protein [Fischerella sp.]
MPIQSSSSDQNITATTTAYIDPDLLRAAIAITITGGGDRL